MARVAFPPLRTDTAKTPASFASVLITNTALVASHDDRVELTITNDSANVVYLSLGGTAVAGSGIRLNANGGQYTTSSYTGAVSAIAVGGTSNVAFSEV